LEWNYRQTWCCVLRAIMNLIEFIESRRDEHLSELCSFLRIPSVSAKSEHKPDIQRAAEWVAGNLRGAGLKRVEIVPTKLHQTDGTVLRSL
jgi:acetylornithine deacetylase/succinyl-diaminopimelate desuccinylase-like protein